ncbi:MAG: transcription elongation factor GreA [Treponema sp.]|nr:transcription elongation factor GreA [Treponema sp.]MBQ4236059.1 transcription elongation factor GreA [Treponema sp.]MBQ5384506.1 transcription elongation factor GreA [Treponema sp.]
MSEELENSVSEMLKEEKWTRAGISGFNLSELEEILKRAKKENCEKRIKEISDEQLTHTKDSIVALYLSGMIGLRDGSLDNSNLETLIDILEKNHKSTVVEQICTSILVSEPTNKFALRKLADYYKVNNDDRIWALYEKIVLIDFEEADIAKILADRYEKQQNLEAALSYYKKALLRYINAKNFSGAKEMWNKVIYLSSSDLKKEMDFLLMAEKKVAKNIGEDRAVTLLEDLYLHFNNIADWDTAISMLKSILELDNKDSTARRDLVECYRKKYAEKSNLDSYIRDSDLESSFRNVFEAINDFEKHIAFDKGSFVYHRTWGVGKITNVADDKLKINFGKKNGVKENITLKMAVEALQPLPKNHFWVKKATTKKEVLAKEVKENVVATLKSIIRSHNNACDEKHIKNELYNVVLTPGEWTSWHQNAQKELKTNKIFAVNPNNKDQYMVRDRELSQSERLGNEFKAEKQFFPRVEIILRYAMDETVDNSDETFSEMFNYFASYLKSINNVDECTVGSYLVLKHITDTGKFTNYQMPAKFTFENLYSDIENPREIYAALKNQTIKDDFLKYIEFLPDWDVQYIKLFPTVLEAKMIESLISKGKEDLVKKLVADSFEDYRNYREAVVYFFKECREEEWYKAANIAYEKQLVTLVNIVALCYLEVDNHVKTTENKKIIKTAVSLLFEEKVGPEKKIRNNVLDYMNNSDVETINKLYTLINDVVGLDPKYKTQLRNGIIGKYPDFKFPEAEIKQEVQKGRLVTAKMLEEKKKQADILEHEILPQIQKEIAIAKEKGDLRENAEYQAAKDKSALENKNLQDLRKEIAEAVIFDPTTITTSFVSFGTTVTIHDNKANNDIVYTILGPWESDVENGILSYLSPRGQRLMDTKVGDNVKFTFNGVDYDWTITSIVAAKI